MTDQTRRVWRAGPATLVLVWIFALAAGVAVPVLAYLIYQQGGTPWIPGALVVLTVLALIYAWRFGLHPKLRVDAETVQVVNPFRRHEFDWDDVTLIAPGENGLLIGTEDDVAEAWCIQKSNYAARRGRFTRADRVAHELLDILDLHDPPLEDEETGLRIRRARPDESRLLTRLERAASEDALDPHLPARGACVPRRRGHPALARTAASTGTSGCTSWSCSTPRSDTSRSMPRRSATWEWSGIRPGGATARPWSSSPAWRSSPAVPAKPNCGCWSTTNRPGRSTDPTAGPRPTSGESLSIRRTPRRC